MLVHPVPARLGQRKFGDEVERHAARDDLFEAGAEIDSELGIEEPGLFAGRDLGMLHLDLGGATEIEVKERKDRVDDALNATRAAVEEGVVPGGGVMLLKASANITVKGLNEDEEAGIQIVRRALQSPIRQISENAGVEGSIVVGKVLESKGANFGYDAQNDEYGDMIEKGIIDPAKVVRTALQDAASIAGLLITTEAGIAERPKKDSGGGMPGGMGGMGGMGDMM